MHEGTGTKCRALIRPVVMLLLGVVASFLSGCGTCLRGQLDGVCRGTKKDALSLEIIVVEDHPNRAEISRRVCRQLQWLRPDGRLKDMSCRVALLRLHREGLICLPPPAR